ncbi:MAG: SCP2 sterol-binding domain-containing protein [Candidatus Baldrarchaeia archaeon]
MSMAETFKQAVEAKKEELKEDIASMEMTVQIKVEDKPEENYYVEISGGEIKVGKGEHSSPTVTFIATTEIFNKIISGELDGTAAYMSGQLKIEGSLPDAMAFGNLLQKLR